jgi:putative addiction module CopG family antidote
MNVDLTPELHEFIAEEVRRGRYGTPQAVVEDAVNLLAARSETEQRLRSLLRRSVPLREIGDPTENNWEVLQQEVLTRLRR